MHLVLVTHREMSDYCFLEFIMVDNDFCLIKFLHLHTWYLSHSVICRLCCIVAYNDRPPCAYVIRIQDGGLSLAFICSQINKIEKLSRVDDERYTMTRNVIEKAIAKEQCRFSCRNIIANNVTCLKNRLYDKLPPAFHHYSILAKWTNDHNGTFRKYKNPVAASSNVASPSFVALSEWSENPMK